ncbi:30S ribosomal protein S18 [Candidatus Giovannonibacteria bacterium RIFCSPLOWO2_02_44_8]|uniref:Small ribosomal subunit protein bS18 n=2 Tax=Candidatus Giovannoniibacteriota TaxID=1752738 RepID=A0A1F5XCE1_9BACT|nr:MAG: 30S ribosomal protein S18 [Candidatus Giovannonibacteria bacterium RIFCSPHIGHO2_02_43_16]OGF85583.1 MAG: 30S ribosomal protein S18 [Candidatus Giovannonibacteria bacterium RIFCSPLOWO2_02_44_8]
MRYHSKNIEKQCHFCTSNVKRVDYKDTLVLKRFLDPQYKIMPKRKSGLCSLHQRKLARAVKRARVIALLPFIVR